MSRPRGELGWNLEHFGGVSLSTFALPSCVPGPGLGAGTRRMNKMAQESVGRGWEHAPAGTAPGAWTTPRLVAVTLGISENRL